MSEKVEYEDRETIEEYEKKIEINLSIAQIFNKISIILSASIYLICLFPSYIADEFYISETIAAIFAIILWASLYFNMEQVVKSNHTQTREGELRTQILSHCFRELFFIFIFIFMIFFDSVHISRGYSDSFWGVIGYSFGFLGRFLNIAIITVFIEKVFLVKAWYYLNCKYDLETAPVTERIKQQEIAEKRNQKASQLLAKVGKKFFVENFEKLKNWDILDITDDLDNGSNQIERIKTGKKIFEEGLERIVLIKIIDSEDSIDKATINKAKKLLEK